MTPDYILQNLNGLGPIDWEQAFKDFPIAEYTPDKLKIVPRDEVMLSLVDVAAPLPAVEVLLADWNNQNDPATDEAKQLRALARNYVVLSNKEARLPKFSKWVSSMFAGNNQLMIELSKAAQVGAKPTKAADNGIIISCNPVDILMGGMSKYFNTCLGHGGKADKGGYGGNYRKVLQGALERCPGIGIAYMRADDGFLKCRIWLNHGRVDGKDVICVMSPYGNGFDLNAVAKLIASKGYDVYQVGWGARGAAKKIEWVGVFNGEHIHWDIIEGQHMGVCVAQAEPQKKVAA